MTRKLKDTWSGNKKSEVGDIPSFVNESYGVQLAAIWGRVLSLEKTVQTYDEELNDLFVAFAEESVEVGDLEEIGSLEEAAARILLLEAKITALRGAMTFLGTFDDADPIGIRPKLKAAKLARDLKLPPIDYGGE